MENYKICSKLGKGAQGSVFLTEAKDNPGGNKYVLKKIECNDESEANKAFKEAVALQELKNPYVCGYREFFVNWDTEEKAMNVCIVMDYYKHGDLDKVLKTKRKKKEAIEELVLKKWLGQMIEALVFIHSKGIIHRDLKPSNIFITDNLSIKLGDFGVATVMGDARTKTRTTVGSMNWMAPEVLERPYDERSDVWSAGCITLEMATCGIYDSTEMSAKLFQIKNSPQDLEEILEDIKKQDKTKYSEDLIGVLRTMLRRAFKQRPTAEELTKMPYIKECLALNNKGVMEKKKQDASAAAKKPVPKDANETVLLDYLQENVGNEMCVRGALEALVGLTKQEGVVIPDPGKRLIAKSMTNHGINVDVQIAGCQVLNNLAVTATEDDVLYSKEVMRAVNDAMKCHQKSDALMQAGAAVVMALSSDENAAQFLGEKGAVQNVLSAMRAFPNKAELIATCCNALWSLAVNEGNAKILTEEKGLHDVCEAMRSHSESADLVEAAAAALLSLSMEDENIEMISDENCVALLVKAMTNHMKEAKVVKNACMALTSLVEQDEESAYRVLNNDDVRGIPVLLKAYTEHKDNAEVVENICALITELCDYDDIIEEMKASNVSRILNEIHKRFKENKDIITPCEAALAKIGGKK